jgi:hypothetical protein
MPSTPADAAKIEMAGIVICAALARGVLRLREQFASLPAHSAQDDNAIAFVPSCKSPLTTLELPRHRIRRVCIIIKPAPRLLSIPTSHHQPF